MSNLLSNYTLELYDGTGALLADLGGYYESFNYTVVRNRPETIQAVFNLQIIEDFARDLGTDVQTLFRVGVNEIRVKRGSNYICAGQINHVEAGLSGQTGFYRVRCIGWLGLFKDRFTDNYRYFSGTDAGTIAWTLIDESQSQTNGDFGVTQGTIETSISRQRTYEYKNIQEAIVQLSEVINGFDFEFTYDKVFNVFYPRQSKRTTPVNFEWPRNIESISVQYDGTNLVNSAIVRGQGFGDEQLVVTRTSTGAQATYMLREKIFDFSSVKETTTLNEHGDAELSAAAIPIEIPAVTLIPNLDGTQPVIKQDYWLDDDFTIKTESDFLNSIATNTYRIESIEVNVDADDVEKVTINQGLKEMGVETTGSETTTNSANNPTASQFNIMSKIAAGTKLGKPAASKGPRRSI